MGTEVEVEEALRTGLRLIAKEWCHDHNQLVREINKFCKMSLPDRRNESVGDWALELYERQQELKARLRILEQLLGGGGEEHAQGDR